MKYDSSMLTHSEENLEPIPVPKEILHCAWNIIEVMS